MSSSQFHQHFQKTPLRRFQSGLSLVELMVAMTIGLFLMGAVGLIYVTTATSSRGSTLESQMNEDATLALDLLQQQIRLAGFSTIDNNNARRFNGIAVRGCDGDFVDGSGGTTAFGSLACGTTGQDALAIRYEATALNSQVVGTPALPANCGNNGITPWVAGQPEGSSVSISLADNRYYIANDANGVPSLFCRGRDGMPSPGGFSNAIALIPNIEGMQIMYGITNAPGDDDPLPHQVTAYVNANSTTMTTAAPSRTLADNWGRVAAIRICLLARTAQPVPLGDNTVATLGRYTDCTGAVVTNNDRFLRRAYVTTIQLRNTRPGLPSRYQVNNAVVVNPWAYMEEL